MVDTPEATSLTHFHPLNKIGEGSFSSVYKVKRNADSKIYALKKVCLLSYRLSCSIWVPKISIILSIRPESLHLSSRLLLFNIKKLFMMKVRMLFVSSWSGQVKLFLFRWRRSPENVDVASLKKQAAWWVKNMESSCRDTIWFRTSSLQKHFASRSKDCQHFYLRRDFQNRWYECV